MGNIYIGTELRRLREAAGLTQAALAKTLGVHINSVNGWERDAHPVDAIKAKAILASVRAMKTTKSKKGTK